MSTPAVDPHVIRFGVFELDLQSRELRKSGIRIKLQDQPFQILAMLLARPGEVITREDLQKRLWPEDTFVDFDLSLNSAVKKLRQALGDDSENPRFVETLYRRGYRFVGPVNGASPSQPSTLEGLSPAPEILAPQSEQAPPSGSVFAGTRRRLFYSAVLAAILVSFVLYFFLRPVPPPRVFGYTQVTHDNRMKWGLVNDGQRIYFTEADRDHMMLGQVAVSGGETAPLPSPFTDVGVSGIAQDGSALLLGAWDRSVEKANLWSLPLPTGPPRRLGDLVATAAAWSRDGNRLAFGRDSAIFLANADGSQPQKLVSLEGDAFGMRFSIDDRRLRFSVRDLKSGSDALWEVRTDGTGLRPLLPGWSQPPHECCGNWTPDGKYYVFQSFRNGRSDLWVLREGENWLRQPAQPVQVTNGPLDFSSAVVSEDGKRIFTVGQQPRGEVLRYDSKSDAFIPFLGGISASDLAFSADGQWVAYVTVPDQSLWRSKRDGSERLQLTFSGTWAAMPRWSPDGKQIAFMRQTLKADWRAYAISRDGGEPQDLAPGTDAGFDPTWSSDGKSIALSTHDLGATSQGIEVLDLQTRKLSQLPESQELFSPRWSPDGKYIAAVNTDSDTLMLFELSTQRWTKLVDTTLIGYPSWSHDSQYLYFDTTFTQDPALYRIRILDHKLEKLRTLKDERRYWGVFGPSWSGLTPDDSPLILRDTGSQEIYAIDWRP
jgi:Tol biopolymer transport system component/DNA-binding winged helix-turn-helix (wHTH) protein